MGMSCSSAIFLENSGSNTVTEGGIIPVGNIMRRFGSNLNVSGTGIVASGSGYYLVDSSFTVAPSAVGTVGISLLIDGESVGSVTQAYGTTAEEPVNITVVGLVRVTCCDNARKFIEFELTNNTGVVTQSNIVIAKV